MIKLFKYNILFAMTNTLAVFILVTIFHIATSAVEKITFISLERVNVTYCNPKYVTYANATARRYSRTDPVYYLDLHFSTNFTIDNNVGVDFHFYEWLTNTYKRSFVEFHFRACDMLQNSLLFGSAMRQGKFLKSCPYPPSSYNLYNMTIPTTAIPPHFPFTKGRIYTNFTHLPTMEYISGGYADMEVKTIKRKRKN